MSFRKILVLLLTALVLPTADAASLRVCIDDSGQIFAKRRCKFGQEKALSLSELSKLLKLSATTGNSLTSADVNALIACNDRNKAGQDRHDRITALLAYIKIYADGLSSWSSFPSVPSTLTDLNKAEESFNTAVGRVNAEDYSVLSDVVDAADTYLATARGYYASSPSYRISSGGAATGTARKQTALARAHLERRVRRDFGNTKYA